jgi:hypothetical protein
LSNYREDLLEHLLEHLDRANRWALNLPDRRLSQRRYFIPLIMTSPSQAEEQHCYKEEPTMMQRIADISETSPSGTVDPPSAGMAEHTDPPVDAIHPAHRGAVAVQGRVRNSPEETPAPAAAAGDEQSLTTAVLPGLSTIFLVKQHCYPPDPAEAVAATTATAADSSDLPYRQPRRQSVSSLSAITPLINVVIATPVSEPPISSEERRLRLQQRNLELQLQLRERELDLERQRVAKHQVHQLSTARVGTFIVVAAMFLAVAAVVGACSAGKCGGSDASSSDHSTRAYEILAYIESISLLTSGRRVRYPDGSTPEGRAVTWLIEKDLGTEPSDELALRQRYALATLWFQRSPPSMGHGLEMDNFTSTWGSSTNECSWFRVILCDNDGRVTRLWLDKDQVRGHIPDELGLLTGLTALHLGRNMFTGTIPSSLAELTALTRLVLSRNAMTGTIPSSLGALTALTGLELYSNRLKGSIPSSFGALTNLTTLLLHNNTLVGTMPCTSLNQPFTELVADCNEVGCTCCTHCCPSGWNGTSSLKNVIADRCGDT